MANLPSDVYTLGVNQTKTLLKAVGSAWLAALLLLLVLVAMACATAYESVHGSELALLMFYKSWWFQLLLYLFALNVLGAVLARLPLNRNQIGLVVTHLAILLILGGAWVTKRFGIEGRVEIREGQTAQAFTVPQDSVILERSGGRARTAIDLDPAVFNRLRTVASPGLAPLTLDDLKVEIEAYAPDSTEREEVVDDAPQTQSAVELTLGAGHQKMTRWVFADQPSEMSPLGVIVRRIAEREEFARLLDPAPASQPVSNGTVRVEVGEQQFDYPLEQCLGRGVAVAETGFSIKVLRYLPHAMVGADRQIHSASNQAVNPAVEVEVSGPRGIFKRWAFARFPDLSSMHGAKAADDLKVVFVASADDAPIAPVEILVGPSDELVVRFAARDGTRTIVKAAPGQPVATPFEGMSLEIGRFLTHARVDRIVEPLPTAGEEPIPALQVALTAPAGTDRFWLRRFDSRQMESGGSTYHLHYAYKTLPLGFLVRLDRFHIDKYAGTERPRSFQSHVTFLEPASGREQGQVISMNKPASHGGYTLFQSSYDLSGGRPASSILSVSRDPGRPIVFFGYIAMLAGMVWIVVSRMLDRRRFVPIQ